MNHKYIQDQQVIERYLQDRLTPEELEEFEAYYLEHPDILDELELATQLRQGLQNLNAAGRLAQASPQRSGWPSLLSTPQYSVAASVLVVVTLLVAGGLYRQNLELQEFVPLANTRVTQLVPLLALRGSTATEVSVADAENWVVLLVDPGFTEFASYRATISGEAGVVHELDGLEPGYEALVAVGVPGSLLTPGDYELRLEGRMADWTSERGYDVVTQVPFQATSGD